MCIDSDWNYSIENCLRSEYFLLNLWFLNIVNSMHIDSFIEKKNNIQQFNKQWTLFMQHLEWLFSEYFEMWTKKKNAKNQTVTYPAITIVITTIIIIIISKCQNIVVIWFHANVFVFYILLNFVTFYRLLYRNVNFLII